MCTCVVRAVPAGVVESKGHEEHAPGGHNPIEVDGEYQQELEETTAADLRHEHLKLVVLHGRGEKS